MSSRSALHLLLVGLAFLLAAPAAHAKKLSKDDKARLDKGEVIVDAREVGEHEATLARAIGIVDAPPAQVWKHIDRCADYKEFLPRVVDSEELSRDGEKVKCRTVVDLPFPLGSLESRLNCRHRKLKGDRFERTWKFYEGAYYVNEGRWRLSPWGDGGKRTLVEYTIKVAPKMKLPSTLRREAQKMTLPKVIDAVRKRVKETAK